MPKSSASPKFLWPALLSILFLGAAFRFAPALRGGWVVGDGGLFVDMAHAILAQNFALPTSVSYPTSSPIVPFAYPPLAFYGAAFGLWLGISPDDIFRFGPAFWSTLSVYFFWRMARVVFDEETPALVASLFYALWFYAFLWSIQGGGLPRAPGLCFAIGAIEGGLRLWKRGESKGLWLAAFWLSLTFLTHLERAHVAVLSLGVVALAFGKWRYQTLKQLLQILAVAFAVSAPWWGFIWWRFGLDPFLNARASGSPTNSLPFGVWQTEPFLPIFHCVAALGFFACLRKRQWFLPLWIAAIFFLANRSPSTSASIPLALLGASALQSLPKFRALATFCLAAWLAFGLFFAVRIVRVLPASERDLMAWVSQNTPPQARFLVFPNANWASDSRGEWFPTLARRASVSTVQGAEWLPKGEFARRLQSHDALLKAKSWTQIEVLAQREMWRFDYFVAPTKFSPDRGWRKIHQHENLVVWRRLSDS